MTCRHCERDFKPYHGKPGKIDECTECAKDIPIYRAEQGTGDDGTVETMTTKPLYRETWHVTTIGEDDETDS